MTRTQSTLRNAKLSVACQIITLLTSFVARAFVARFLISEYYLSLSGLFSNVLTVISLAELGVGAAVSFSLYKPLSENDETKVRALMRFFRRAYTIIGIAVFSLGIALTPVLNFLINDFDDVKSAIPEFYLIYVLYVVNTAVSYFFSYKKTLIVADQKKYIFSFIAAASSILLCASRCVAIAFFQNYVLYMVLAVVFTVVENVVISGCANKLYPYLKNREKCKLSGEDLSVIKTNMGASVMHSIGGVAVNGTDNILISKIVGFISEGIYTNYHMITAALDGIIGITLESSTPSFGNLCASDDSEHKITVFNRMFFASSWLYGFSAICFYILVNPFISLWIGKEMFLSPAAVVLITLNFYLRGMRRPALIARDAMGLIRYDKWKSVAEAAINLAASVFLALEFGVVGVILGTTVSFVSTCFWVEPLVVYRHGFGKSVGAYFARYTFYAISAFAAFIPTAVLCNLIAPGGIFGLIVKALICVTVPNIIFTLIYMKTSEMKYYTGLFLKGKKQDGEDSELQSEP